MASLEELEARLAVVERQVAEARQDSAAARILAGAADRDVSEFRQTLNAHTRLLNALRETQVEHQAEMREHKAETREGFAMVNVGMAQIYCLAPDLDRQELTHR